MEQWKGNTDGASVFLILLKKALFERDLIQGV